MLKLNFKEMKYVDLNFFDDGAKRSHLPSSTPTIVVEKSLGDRGNEKSHSLKQRRVGYQN
jgi:hypothetical protein